MRILAIDTTGPACSVALRLPGQEDFLCTEPMQRGQAERLAPMAQDMLAHAGLAPSEIDRIGVAVGPGSFAGSRIGVAFARGLALATGAECVGISNLEWWLGEKGRSHDGPVVSVHDAKRGELVLQVFQGGLAQQDAATLSIETARKYADDLALPIWSGKAVMVVGSGLPLIAGSSDTGLWPPADLPGLLDLIEGQAPPFDAPKPFYARPPDAKLPGGREA